MNAKRCVCWRAVAAGLLAVDTAVAAEAAKSGGGRLATVLFLIFLVLILSTQTIPGLRLFFSSLWDLFFSRMQSPSLEGPGPVSAIAVDGIRAERVGRGPESNSTLRLIPSRVRGLFRSDPGRPTLADRGHPERAAEEGVYREGGKTGGLLIADDDPLSRLQLATLFIGSGYDVLTANSAARVLEGLLKNIADVAILGERIDGFSTADLLPIIRKCNRKTKIIIASEEVPLQEMRSLRNQGIFYHALKPLTGTNDGDELRLAVACAFGGNCGKGGESAPTAPAA
jgi:CheY-like chemotaxis protein